MSRFRPLGALLLIIFSLQLVAHGRQPPPQRAEPRTAVAAAPPAATPRTEAERRRAAFEMVWQTVRDNHFDPRFGGVGCGDLSPLSAVAGTGILFMEGGAEPEEIRMLKARHPHMTTLIFDDDLFTLNKKYVLDLNYVDYANNNFDPLFDRDYYSAAFSVTF